jgi:hypothetical protein
LVIIVDKRILQGLPGLEPISTAPQIAPETGRVSAGAATDRAARSKSKKARNSRPSPEADR